MTGTSSDSVEQTEEDAGFRRESERIEALLGELAQIAGPQALGRIEELLERMVRVYGAGLGRALRHAHDAGASIEELEARLCADELVSSLLLLHGLHPKSTAERVHAALDEVRPYLGSHAGDVEVVRIDDRAVTLRLLGSCQGCPSSRATLEHTIERAIYEAAPEIAAIEVEGEARPPRDLVQLGPGRGPKRVWRTLTAPAPETPGERITLRIEGVSVVVFRVGDALLAYRDACAGCATELASATLAGGTLECATCGARYDLARAGRGPEGGPHLEPLPLLSNAEGVRIALPGGVA